MSILNSKRITFSDIKNKLGQNAPNVLSEYYKGGNFISLENSTNSLPETGRISLGNFKDFKRDKKTFGQNEGIFWKWGVGIWDYSIYSHGHISNNQWVNINDIIPNCFQNLTGFAPTRVTLIATGREVKFCIKCQEDGEATEVINLGINQGPGVSVFETTSSQPFTFSLNDAGDLWILSKLAQTTYSSSPVGGCIKITQAE